MHWKLELLKDGQGRQEHLSQGSCQDAIQTFALELAEFYLSLSTSAGGRCDKDSLELYRI